MDNPNLKPVIIDVGISPAERATMRILEKEVVRVFARHDVQPNVAFTVLMNVLGSLIGTQMDETDRTDALLKAGFLSMYVEAYRVREKKI